MEVLNLASKVGASIVQIITESLYDKPLVIFREYVQNSADSIAQAKKDEKVKDLSIEIWAHNNDLYFLDNGTGILRENFDFTMSSIAGSNKSRREYIGYKGIGRLSGLSYCKRLTFINILDYQQNLFQTYTIDCSKYANLRKKEDLNKLDFSELMSRIANLDEQPNPEEIRILLKEHEGMFGTRHTGFLVVLEELSKVLVSAMQDKQFIEDLEWLLPIPFKNEMLIPCDTDGQSVHELFVSLSSEPAFSDIQYIPAQAYRVLYNGMALERPIERKSLRDYTCRCDLEQYAICVHSFSNTGIAIDSKNSFSGIRLYIDNMLLCNETELIPALQQFGMLSHSVNETIQAVRGIGAAVYIVDKLSISANARRTFIDITDDDSLRFLELLSEFVESVFRARYALSNYKSVMAKTQAAEEEKRKVSDAAREALIKLAGKEISIEEESVEHTAFSDLSLTERKRIVKSKITQALSQKIKRYIEQITECDVESCVEDFLTWLKANRS